MKIKILLVLFFHLPLLNSMPMQSMVGIKVITASHAEKPIEVGVNNLHVVQAAGHGPEIHSSVLPHTDSLPKIPENAHSKDAESTKLPTFDDSVSSSSFTHSENSSPPSSPASDTSSTKSSLSFDTLGSSMDKGRVKMKSKAVEIYNRLLKQASEPPPPPPPPPSTLVETVKQILSNPRQLAQNPMQLFSNSLHYFSSSKPKSEITVTTPQLAKLNLDAGDLAKWNTFRSSQPAGNQVHIDNDIINQYYGLYAGSKTRPALIEVNHDTMKSLDQWRRRNRIPYSFIQNFMKHKVLKPYEFERRSRAVQAQVEQARIYRGWELTIERISLHTGYTKEDVTAFGNALGGKGLFPSFSGYDFGQTLQRLETLQKEHGRLAKAWQDHLQSDYNERLKLLRTLSQLKHPRAVPPEMISAWSAQAADVNKMLKTVDYLETRFKEAEETAADPLLVNADDVVEFQSQHNIGRLEYRLLGDLPTQQGRFSELRASVKEFTMLPQSPKAAKLMDKLERQKLDEYPGKKFAWITLLKKAKDFLDRMLKVIWLR